MRMWQGCESGALVMASVLFSDSWDASLQVSGLHHVWVSQQSKSLDKSSHQIPAMVAPCWTISLQNYEKEIPVVYKPSGQSMVLVTAAHLVYSLQQPKQSCWNRSLTKSCPLHRTCQELSFSLGLKVISFARPTRFCTVRHCQPHPPLLHLSDLSCFLSS